MGRAWRASCRSCLICGDRAKARQMRLTQTATAGHRPGAPVGGVLWHRLQGQGQYSFHIVIGNSPGTAAAGLVHKPVQSLLQEP